MRKLNLIGVYGSESSRRALVRLPNGRFKKVKVGDRVDGSQVTSISSDAIRLVKGGRNIVLEMPQG
jgi:type IV pilus biogenesis protein PilP